MKSILITTFAILSFVWKMQAQAGNNDFSFNPGTGANQWVWTTALQSDGKIIVGGDFTTFNGTARNRIVRLNANGSLDPTFDPGTGVNGTVRTISVQSDGKIVIGGLFNTYNGTGRKYIARLNPDGTLDATFNPGTGAGGYVLTSSIQDDGKIIIGGYFTSYNGTAANRIARLNVDGSLDGSFNQGTGADESILVTSIQSDGKIMIGGTFNVYNGITRNLIARLNADGTLDGSFDPGSGANSFVSTICFQSDNKIIIGGHFTFYNGTQINRIARLNPNGTIDDTFNQVGEGPGDFVRTMAIQNDGKIIIGGDFIYYNVTPRKYIARLNPDGGLDGTFNYETGANNRVWSTAIQSDGKIVIGGEFTTYKGTTRNRVARIHGGPTTEVLPLTQLTGIRMYPNPASVEATLQSDYELKNATLTIYSTQGKLVKEITNISGNTHTLHLDKLAGGLYLIKVTEKSQAILTDKFEIMD